MSMLSRFSAVALAAALLGSVGVASATPGSLEVKGILEAISAQQARVAGIEYAINSSTRFEGTNDQPIAIGELTVGAEVEVKYTEAAGARTALEIELEGPDDSSGGNSGGGSSGNGTPAVRHKLKLTGASARGSVSSLEKPGRISKLEAKAKITLAEPLAAGAPLPAVTLTIPGGTCELKVKGKKRRSRGESSGGGSSAGVSLLEASLQVVAKTKAGVVRIKNEKGSCVDGSGQPAAPVLHSGDGVTIAVADAVVLSGAVQ